MPKTLIQSVVSELQREQKRLEDELHRVTAALTAFGKVYLRGRNPSRTISAAGRKRIAARSTGAVGKDQGAKGCFNRLPQGTHNVPICP